MGNSPSSVHDDTSEHHDQPAFSFGPELELVLTPQPDKWNELQGAAPELYQKFSQIPKTFAATDKRYKDFRLEWAECIALVLQFVLKNEVRVIYAHSSSAEKLKEKGTYYTYWTVIEDGTIEADPNVGEWSVEIVSRVLYTHGKDWTKEYGRIWSVIEHYFVINKEKRESTHVHLKQVPMTLKAAESTSLAYAKAVSKFVVFWDPCMCLLAPQKRRESEYCRSNLLVSKLLYFALQQATKEKGKYQEIFNTIDECRTLEAVVEFMGPKGKDFAWNYLYLISAKPPAPKPSGTIEYRRPSGSRSLMDMCQSVTISLCFVYGAVNVLKVDPRLYEFMASTDVVCPEDKFSFNATLQQDNVLLGFGITYFERFIAWMRASADALGLKEFLPEDIIKDIMDSITKDITND